MSTTLCFCTKSAERLKSAYLSSTGEHIADKTLSLLAGQKLYAKDYDKKTRSGKIEDPVMKGRWITLPPNSLILIGGKPIENSTSSELTSVKRAPVQKTPSPQKRHPLKTTKQNSDKVDVVSRMLHQNEEVWKSRDKNVNPECHFINIILQDLLLEIKRKAENKLKEKFLEEDKHLKKEFKQMKNFTDALNKMGETIRERERKKKAKLLQRKIALVPVVCDSISQMPCANSNALLDADIKRFHSEGAICLRNVIDKETIEIMLNSVKFEQARAQHIPISSMGKFDAPYETKSGFNSLLMSLKSKVFHEFATQPKLQSIAQRFMRSKSCLLLYDHIIIKDKKHTHHTSWHFDLNYWPLKGEDMVSMWILLDDCPCDAGLLQFVRGSHLEDNSEIPHVEQMRGKDLDVMGMNSMKAGDAMLFWGKTLHGASGNMTNASSRRAISLRFLGDNVWFDPSHIDCPSENYAYCKGVLMGSMLSRNKAWIQNPDASTEI